MESRTRVRRPLLIMLLATVTVCTAASLSLAQEKITYNGSFFVNPFGGGAAPTGRFGETDPDAAPPKSGHKAGFCFGGDVGYFVSDNLILGIGARQTSFDIDFGAAIEAIFPAKSAKTKVVVAELWARWFLADSFDRWRPYLVGGVGMGRPKGSIDYESPFIISLPDNQGTIELASVQSTVNTAVLVTGGIGVLIPVNPTLAFNLEPRYTVVSTKGTDRTDEFTTADGSTLEFQDTAKSNSNWWEIRGGVVISIR